MNQIRLLIHFRQFQNLKMAEYGLLYLGVCGLGNIVSSQIGHRAISFGDKDILLPFSSAIFLFISLLIYIPQTHFKYVKAHLSEFESPQRQIQQEQQMFPMVFLITLISIVVSIFIDTVYRKIALATEEQAKQLLKQQNEKRPTSTEEINSNESIEQNSKVKASILKYFLTIALTFTNFSMGYYITIENKKKLMDYEILVFGIFSQMINFGFGYILAWSGLTNKFFNAIITSLTVFGLIGGIILEIFVKKTIIVLLLPAICSGLFIYSSAFICIPQLFHGGNFILRDKFRFASIFATLLLTLVYYPFCYLLRI